MNKISKYIIKVFMAVFILLFFFINSNFAQKEGLIEFNSQVNVYPVYPKKDKIYIINNAPLSQQDAKMLTSKYKVNNIITNNFGKKGNDRNFFATDDTGTKMLMVDLKTGRVLFKINSMQEKNINMPSREEAVKIAKKKLEEINKYGANMKVDAIGSLIKEFIDLQGNKTKPEVMQYKVNFVRILNGKPTIGMSNMASIWVGDKGEIVGFDYDVNTIKAFREVLIRSPQEALKKFEKALKKRKTDLVGVTKVTVKGMEYTYYTFSENSDNIRYLKPVYLIKGTAVFSPGGTQEIEYPFPAIKERAII